MACRGCANQQCSCFSANSDSTTTTGNGSQYAPITFRPSDVPFPRPFGHLYGVTDQSLDGAAYTAFLASTPDIDLGGNMRAGNGTNLIARADGIHLVGINVPFLGINADTIDQFSIRRNGVQVSSGSIAQNATISAGQILFMSTVTLLDLNTGDLLDLFVERVTGVGSVSVDFTDIGTAIAPRIWATWIGGAI